MSTNDPQEEQPQAPVFDDTLLFGTVVFDDADEKEAE